MVPLVQSLKDSYNEILKLKIETSPFATNYRTYKKDNVVVAFYTDDFFLEFKNENGIRKAALTPSQVASKIAKVNKEQVNYTTEEKESKWISI